MIVEQVVAGEYLHLRPLQGPYQHLFQIPLSQLHLLEVDPPIMEALLIKITLTAMLPILERGRGDHLQPQPNEVLILPFSKTSMLEL